MRRPCRSARHSHSPTSARSPTRSRRWRHASLASCPLATSPPPLSLPSLSPRRRLWPAAVRAVSTATLRCPVPRRCLRRPPPSPPPSHPTRPFMAWSWAARSSSSTAPCTRLADMISQPPTPRSTVCLTRSQRPTSWSTALWKARNRLSAPSLHRTHRSRNSSTSRRHPPSSSRPPPSRRRHRRRRRPLTPLSPPPPPPPCRCRASSSSSRRRSSPR
mmetsp:Transcript_11211/g.33636  ORF Transcript_11211/g.33636 Transcript_11211/m.33636 type:complete len:217 (+) Transcript_11211:834-1484(+)